AHVDEVRGDIHQQWPVDGVGADQCDVVLAQQLDEGRVAEARVPDLHRVTDSAAPIALQPRPAFQAMVVAPATGRSLLGVAWQQLEEGLELLRVEAEIGWEL